MSYGIKMYNSLGVLNLTDDSKALQLHDTGDVLVPARTKIDDITYPGYVEPTIIPIRYQGVLEIVDIDPTMITLFHQWSLSIFWPYDALDINNNLYKIKIESWSTDARWVRWRCWKYI